MSPLWRDRVCISLSPGRAGLLRFGRGWKPKLVRSDVVSDDAGHDDATGSIATKLLGSLLADGERRGADASVVLSNHFVRYAVLPWSDEVVSNQDWEALAQHHFRIIYGDAALEWVTTVHWQGPGRPVLACASPKLLIDAIRGTLRAANLRLGSLSPYFVAAFNFCRPQLPQGAFWFGVVEPGRFSFGGFEQGSWVNIASRRLGIDGELRLAETLEQEVLGGDGAAARGRAYVFSPEQPIDTAEDDWGWDLQPLSLGDGGDPVTDSRLAAAATGAG